MSDAKHTPGPWVADGCVVNYDAQLPAIAVCVRHNAEWEANARLIAAAPDLLDALCVAADYLNGNGWEGDPRMVPVEAAIAKAKGKT
jgi:hypothetical protein